MTPKFRGGSDDWLDDEDSSNKKSHKKKTAKPTDGPLAITESNATVVEVFPKLCKVKLDSGGLRLCSYRRASVMAPHPDGIRTRSPVSAGDRVRVTSSDPTSGVVESVCARENFLARPAPDRDGKMIHVLAANLDYLAIVASTKNPDFSPGLVDRFWIAAKRAMIQPVLILTKTDLIDRTNPNRPWQIYQDLGVPFFEVCSKNESGLTEVLAYFTGKRVAFCGHSGVGKTSLLNSLLKNFTGSVQGKVGDVSDLTGKGRHTTTGAVLIDGPSESQWIDTPGVREFGLWGISPEELRIFFPEFTTASCSAKGCAHQDEVDCQARRMPRYDSYKRILTSLLEDRETTLSTL